MTNRRDDEREIAALFARIAERRPDDADLRRAYFEHDFEAFFAYYWGWAFKGFHIRLMRDLASGENVVFKGFRAIRKTTIVRGDIVWRILYAKEPYMIVQSYEDAASGEHVRAVARMLMHPEIVADYGMAFPFESKREDLAKKSAMDFNSTTGVKLASRSLGQTLRGANEYHADTGFARPTRLYLDDVDTEESCRSEASIEQNERKLVNETMGALDPLRRSVVLLGNAIYEDGILPRFEKRYAGKPGWRVRSQALLDADGNCVWPEVFTPEVVAGLRADGDSSFAQNYLLVPFTGKGWIIPRERIVQIPESEVPADLDVVIGIDPAFSTKTGTDAMGLVVTGHSGDGKKYVLRAIAFEGEEKDEERFVAETAKLYARYSPYLCRVERNNGGEIIARMLQRRNMAVDVVTPSKDKMTRLREYEGCFTRGEVFFLPGTEALQEQLAKFPGGAHDDLVDAMVHSFRFEGGDFTVSL